jgi:ABC-type Fe3+/spermidine/putrescine transport system ATPase subunit
MDLRRVLREAGVPAIYVTHDQQEAFAAGERILILHDGRIVRAGTPEEVTGHPGSAWTARFLGLGTVVEGTVRTMGDLRMWIETSVGAVEAERVGGVNIGQAVHVLIRPERIQTSVGASSHRSRVSEVLFTKDRFKVALDSGLYFFAPAAPKLGETLAIRIDGAECLTDD